MKISKRFGFLISLLLISLVIVGCSSNNNNAGDNADQNATNDSASDEQIEITFWHIYSDGPLKDMMTELIAEFEEQNPHIVVDELGTNFFDYFTKLSTAMAGGDGPDLAMNDTTTVPVRASAGSILSIDQFVEQDEDFNVDDFYPVLIDKMTYEGSLYGLPSDTDVRVLYYNKDHFEEVGLDPESPPTNWDELAEYAEQLTVWDSNGLVERMGFSPETGISDLHFHTFAWTNGGEFWDEDGNPTFTSPENLEALQWFKDMNDYYGEAAVSAFRSRASALDYSPFIDGSVSMVVEVNNLYQDIKRYAPDLNFGVAPIPYQVEPATWSAGFDYEIIDNNDEDRAAAAWELLKFLTSEETQIKVHEESGSLVSNMNAAEAPQFMEDPIWATMVEQMDHARFIEYIEALPAWHTTADSAEEAVLNAGVDPEEALQEAQEIAENAVKNH